jgi:hypothetical protein
MPETTTPPDLVEVSGGTLRLNFHRGQWRAWQSSRRFVAVLAGTQSGKTSFGPLWLWREIQRSGPGDYLVATPTFTLLELKALPEFVKHFQQRLRLGRYVGSPVRKFVFSEDGARRTFGSYDPEKPTTVFFGYAEDPESLESATIKAAWLDEAGQRKFKRASWEAIQRRLSIAQGRVLVTTTPYDLGWLKKEFYDRWRAGDPNVDVVRFDSTENPAFSKDEFERARANLPRWKFDLFYRAIFTRPAGLIYDSFDEGRHVVPRFAIPDDWPRFLGLDFGGVNTAGVFYAGEPRTRKLYLYREYKAGGRTAAEHTLHLLKDEPGTPTCVGGSRSEGQWRKEFAAGGLVNGKRVQGLPVLKPDIKEVEVGIGRVYGCHKRDEVFVFEDCEGYLEEKRSYSRVLDASGEPTEEIDAKETFHHLDAERYILGWLRRGYLGSKVPMTEAEELADAEARKLAEDEARKQHLFTHGWH